MKKFIPYAAAAALAAGYAASASAQVTNLPSSGSSDLWLFVADPGAQDTFAVDTGISINSVEPGTFSNSAKASTSNVSTSGFNFSSAALATFIGNSADPGSLQWAVEATQYNGTTDPGAANETAGGVVGIASSNGLVAKVTGVTFNGLSLWAPAFGADLGTYPTADGVIPFSGGVWGATASANAGSTSTYGSGINQAGVTTSQTQSLYLVTGNSTTNGTASYDLGTLKLTDTGGVATLTNTPVAPVPVPAAVWLFGSGLLGLIGVGRRRAA